jgi:tetratricopeptide (TPR) repeat protein
MATLRMTGAESLARMLGDYGVTHFFMVPTGLRNEAIIFSIHALDALRELASPGPVGTAASLSQAQPPQAPYNRAIRLAEAGQYREAIVECQQALAPASREPDARRYTITACLGVQGATLLELGKIPDALAALAQAMGSARELTGTEPDTLLRLFIEVLQHAHRADPGQSEEAYRAVTGDRFPREWR